MNPEHCTELEFDVQGLCGEFNFLVLLGDMVDGVLEEPLGVGEVDKGEGEGRNERLKSDVAFIGVVDDRGLTFSFPRPGGGESEESEIWVTSMTESCRAPSGVEKG